MVKTTAIQDLGSFNKEVRLMKASALATSPVLYLRCALTMEGEKKLKLEEMEELDDDDEDLDIDGAI